MWRHGRVWPVTSSSTDPTTLAEKPEVVALSKADALTDKDRKAAEKSLAKAVGAKPLVISAVSREGVDTALRMLAREIAKADTADPNEVPATHEEPWQP